LEPARLTKEGNMSSEGSIRWWLVLVLLALPVNEARASGTYDFDPDLTVDGLVLASGALTSGAMFAVVDTVYGVQGRLLPKGWAIAQLVAPAPLLLGTALSDSHGGDVSFRAWCGVFSAWFFAHAIWSLVAGESSSHPADTPPPKTRPMRPSRFSVAALRDGAALAFMGAL
jgi:hypothetical protein